MRVQGSAGRCCLHGAIRGRGAATGALTRLSFAGGALEQAVGFRFEQMLAHALVGGRTDRKRSLPRS